MQTNYILATGSAIFGIGATPESAYKHGVQFGEFPPLRDLPRHVQSDGSPYIGRASLALCERALNGSPDCPRALVGDVECTREEADDIDD